MKLRSIFAFLLPIYLLSISTASGDTCEITVSDTTSCAPAPVSFNIDHSFGEDIARVIWDFGDGSFSNQLSPTHVYDVHGNYQPSATVIFTNGDTCETETPFSLTIFDPPEADFAFPGDTVQCFSDNEFCFEDLSTTGEDNAPIESWHWDFEDGDAASEQHPCKTYFSLGAFNISLEVTDSNECTDNIEAGGIEVIQDVSTFFRVSYIEECRPPEVEFINMTDTSAWELDKFYWITGDGMIDSSQQNWSGFQYEYSEPGSYTPSLIVTNTVGCIDSFSLDSEIVHPDFELDVEVLNETNQCNSGNEVQFRHEEVEDINFFTWNFGDPESGPRNTSQTQWEPSHNFTGPGSYDISFSITAHGCTYDTTYCDLVTIYGPTARINATQGPDNDTLPPVPFADGQFPDQTDSCGFSVDDATQYSTLDTVIREDVPLEFEYCNAERSIGSIEVSTTPCYDSTARDVVTWPTDTIFGRDTIYTENRHTWSPGDPHPDDPLVPASGTSNPRMMHDSNTVKQDCGAPNLVHFTNNTSKYRGYTAQDDTTPGYRDECVNPSYPGPSDSLLYKWDFDDEHADNCTSTEENPNPRCRFSTEKRPAHLYTEEGCYSPTLQVIDTITSCTASVSETILMEPPDAGWEGGFDNMTWQKQQNNPGFRTGLELRGDECYGPLHVQRVNIEALIPQCYVENFWVVFDSINDVNKNIRCIDTLYSESGQRDSIVADTQITWDWKSSAQVRDSAMMTWQYNSGGCKTIGVIMKSGSCLDTAWYSNYKCFQELDAAFSIETPEQSSFTCNTYDQHYANSENPFFCQGETLRFSIDNQDMDSIKLYSFRVINLDPGTDFDETDTLPFMQTDPDTLTDLSQEYEYTFDKAGKYMIRGVIEHVNGCRMPYQQKINIGSEINFRSPNRLVCVGDTVRFTNEAFYYKRYCPFDPSIVDHTDTTRYWRDTTGERSESIFWDMTGDGNIDTSGNDPVYFYDSAGNYTVTMYAVDSTGCTTSVVREDYINVTDIRADFMLASGSSRQNRCAPVFLGFQENTELLGDIPEEMDTSHEVASYHWTFGDGKPHSVLSDPSHVYSENGFFDVSLKVSSTLGCKDSIKIDSFIEVDGPMPRFEIISDTAGCEPHTISVRDLSEKTTFRQWRLGDGTTVNTDGDSIVELHYEEAGIYELTLIGGDSVTGPDGETQYCQSTYPDPRNPAHPTYKIHVLPINQVNTDYRQNVCKGDSVLFHNTSDTAYESFQWYTHTGDTLSEDEPVIHFEDSGSYSLILEGLDAPCPVQDTFDINVHKVTAGFDIEEQSGETGLFRFTPVTPESDTYHWTFGDEGHTTRMSPVTVEHQFSRPGYHEVCLVMSNDHGCEDTYCADIAIDTMIRIPNVFSPTGDGVNDYFYPEVEGLVEFEMRIMNRWGETVFYTTDENERWNGQNHNTGNDCEAGTYYYLIRYRHLGGPTKEVKGVLSLMR